MLTRVNSIGHKYFLRSHGDKTEITTNGKSIIVNIPIEDLNRRWYRWQMKGEYIQQAFNNLSDGEREFLITGITSEEWNKMFNGGELDYD
jgi:hypothetical protein